MKIMSFNVLSKDTAELKTKGAAEATVNGYVSARAPMFNKMLDGELPDIVGLQECSAPWRAWLAENLNDKYTYVGTHTKATGEAGYILYLKNKFHVLEDGFFWLAEGAPQVPVVGWDARFDRICCWALFECIECGKKFLFFDTHLDHEGTVARPNQARVILDRIAAMKQMAREKYGIEDCPAILVGDMNSRPDTEAYAVYTNTLNDARVHSKGRTLPDELSTSPWFWYCKSEEDYCRNSHIIDYVFVTPNITVTDYDMIHTCTNLCPYDAYISDHNAVIADVSF